MIDITNLTQRQRELQLKQYHTITIIGVGGVGSWVAYFLAISGQVKRLILIDPDKVEVHNLNRTPYREKDIGQYKVLALKDIITESGRPVDITVITDKYKGTKTLTGRVIDCRDVVDEHTVGNISVGYDGRNMTIHINPKPDKIFRTDDQRGYYQPSYVVPPVLAGIMIVEYFLNGLQNDVEIIRNINLPEFDDWFFGKVAHIENYKVVKYLGHGFKIIENGGKQYIADADGHLLSNGYTNISKLISDKVLDYMDEHYCLFEKALVRVDE